jgi:uncharacterized glyoxalase superfamily protein PhnB
VHDLALVDRREGRVVVRNALAVLRRRPDAGFVELLGEPLEAFWGGGFSWRDPEGNVWDVAWAKGTTLDERGGLTFP